MTAHKKPAPRMTPVAGYGIATVKCNYSPFSSKLKALVVRLAVCGLLPIPVAAWIIRRGGLRNA